MRDKFFNWLLGVFDNNPGGGSMRKVIAWLLAIMAAAIHVVYLILLWKNRYGLDFAETLIEYDYILIGTLLGMVLTQDMFKKKKLPEDPKEEEKKPD